MTQKRINIRAAVNSSRIRREKRHGREVIIVPSATLPDNVVMNRIRYPADEIEKSYKSLEGTPAPLGHPRVSGAFVSASDPVGLALGYIGAHNENVRRENGRVWIDKVIDVEIASQLDRGKAVLNAIEKGEPIHTSTGLIAVMNAAENDDEADLVATSMVFDHDAILIGEKGAATPEQGVGMLVNGEQIEVINSTLDEGLDRELDWIATEALRLAEKVDKAPLIEKVKAYILSLVRGGEAATPATNSETQAEADMPVNEEDFKKLQGDVQTLAATVAGIGEVVANAVAAAIKPIADQTEALTNAAKQADEAELADLRGKIVSAGLMTEDTAKELTLNAARALADQAKPGLAAALNGQMHKPAAKSAGYDLPEGE